MDAISKAMGASCSYMSLSDSVNCGVFELHGCHTMYFVWQNKRGMQ
jgi:hypothetical protein